MRIFSSVLVLEQLLGWMDGSEEDMNDDGWDGWNGMGCNNRKKY